MSEMPNYVEDLDLGFHAYACRFILPFTKLVTWCLIYILLNAIV